MVAIAGERTGGLLFIFIADCDCPPTRLDSASDHPHQLPRLCCPHAVQCDAFRYVLLQPIPWNPARACLAGYTEPSSQAHPRPADARFLGYSSESCGYCKDASNRRRTANSSRCIFSYSTPFTTAWIAMPASRCQSSQRSSPIEAFDVPLRLPALTCRPPRFPSPPLSTTQHHDKRRLHMEHGNEQSFTYPSPPSESHHVSLP